MRRLEAIFRDHRKSGSNNNMLVNTEKSTARRTCTAERKTRTDAEKEQANKRSSTNEGTGISITKMTLMAPTGSDRFLPSFNSRLARLSAVTELAGGDAGTATVELMASPSWEVDFV